MKKFISFFIALFVLFFLMAIPVFAMDISFEWDPNSESDLAGYRLYQSGTSGSYTFGAGNEVMAVLAGTEIGTLVGVMDGKWYWVLTAYDSQGNESGPSNEVSASIDQTAPAPPTNLQFQ